MVKYLLCGAGLQGEAALHHFMQSPDTEQVGVVDINDSKFDGFRQKYGDRVFCFKHNNIPEFLVDSVESVINFVKPQAMLSTVPYSYNLPLTQLAIKKGIHFNDLGGNNSVVASQIELDAKAYVADVSIIPDTGLTPGLVSLLVSEGLKYLDNGKAENVRIRVGGLPQDPSVHLLNYGLFFSVNGLINEYVEPVMALRNHERVTLEPLADREFISFDLPLQGITELEAFNTSGGTSTMPWTLADKVKNMDCKTIRFQGEHLKFFRNLYEMGWLKGEMRKHIESKLQEDLPKNVKDMILLRVELDGSKNGQTVTKYYNMVDLYDEENGISAMQRGTAYTAAIITQMLARGKITSKGVLTQEIDLPGEKVIERLRDTGVKITSGEFDTWV